MFHLSILKDRAVLLGVAQALLMLAIFIAAVCFNGTNDPLLTVFMPLICWLALGMLWPGLNEGWRIPVSFAPLLLLLFWLYLCVGTLWSPVPYISQLFAVLLATLPLVFFMIVMARNPKRAALTFALAFAAGWLGLAFWGMLQFYVLSDTAGRRISGPMLDPNNMAALFNMGLLPAAAWLLASRSKREAAFAALAYALLFSALLVTQSRAGLAIAVLCLILLAAFQCSRFKWPLWKMPVYAFLPVIVYWLVNRQSSNKFSNSIVQLTRPDTSSSVTDRSSLWHSGLRMLKDHPFGDIGLGDFYYFYPAYRGPKDLSDGYFLHCDPMQFALEAGIPAAILFYAFLTAVLVRTLRVWRLLPKDGMARSILLGSFLGLLSIALHAHISYNLYMPGILMPVGILLACWYLAGESAAGWDRRYLFRPAGQRSRAIVAAAMILLLGGMGLWSLDAGLTSHYIGVADGLDTLGQDDEAEALLEKISHFGPPDNFTIYEAQSHLQMKMMRALPDGDPQKVERMKRGMAYVKIARRYNPIFTSFISLEAQYDYLGNGAVFEDGRAAAEKLLEQAVRSNPLDIDSREGLAVVYRDENRPQDALKVLEDGLNWPRPKGQPDIAYILAVANARQSLGDQKGYNEAIAYARQKAQEYGFTEPFAN